MENLAVATGLEKVSFLPNPKDNAKAFVAACFIPHTDRNLFPSSVQEG